MTFVGVGFGRFDVVGISAFGFERLSWLRVLWSRAFEPLLFSFVSHEGYHSPKP